MKTGIRKFGDLLSSIFLLIAIWSATTRLTTTDWTDNLMIVQVCAVLGVLIFKDNLEIVNGYILTIHFGLADQQADKR